MVVDHDPMRDVLLQLEKLPACAAPLNLRQRQEYTREGITKEEISYYVGLMGEAGWLEIQKAAQQSGIFAFGANQLGWVSTPCGDQVRDGLYEDERNSTPDIRHGHC